MQGQRPRDWVDLIKLAKVSNEGFKELLLRLRPTLFNIARSLCPQRAEDLLQAGIIKIWRSLDKIDLKRPDTIRRVAIEIGVYGMQDELRGWLRKVRGEVVNLEEVDFEAPQPIEKVETPVFTGLLAVYKKYIAATGSFKGAHKHVSKLKGTGMHLTRKRYHQAVKRYLGDNGK